MPGPYRTDFWESWLWHNVTIPSSGRVQHVQAVPHTATSWYITGFSIDPEFGLGIVKEPIEFSTFKIFFINDHLPHSVKRGELVSLHFTVFSRLDEAFEANVTMFNAKNQTQFIDRPTGYARQTEMLMVPPKSEALVSFRVKALKLGEMEIRVNASIMKGVISDSFKKIIKVLPEDIVRRKSKSIRFHHETPSNESIDISLCIGKKAKKGSRNVNVTVHPVQQRSKNVTNNYTVSFHYCDKVEIIHVTPRFKENIRIESVPNNVKILSVMFSGIGSAVIEANWQYRQNLINFKPRFIIQIFKVKTSSEWLSQFDICCSFIPKNGAQYSNRTVVEVSIPTGYAMDKHNVLNITTTNPIIENEVQHDGTTMLVYFNYMGQKVTCFSVFVYRRYRLHIRRPSYIMVQDTQRPEVNKIVMFDIY
ncbi:uncharacterized protein LOC126576628 [Anopheles aquasalis]|uniref:uncharacterized protein LOC126576628 n=1 Tax=Anopheles aquasalis TaxID=42839 RepID=UPI00215B0368|nr:uncharacterized protein LOC126576628 [Anopheles aquasalis]